MLTVSVFSTVPVAAELAGATSVSDGAAALSFFSPQEAKATAHAATPPIRRFLFSVFMVIFLGFYSDKIIQAKYKLAHLPRITREIVNLSKRRIAAHKMTSRIKNVTISPAQTNS
jgi:hypothetical protein